MSESPYGNELPGWRSTTEEELWKKAVAENLAKSMMWGGPFFPSSSLTVSAHLVEENHECRICESSFSTSADLKIHMQTHTDGKPFKCSLCTSSFAKTSDLRRHILIHTGEKPHRCSVCDASFVRASHLKSHMRKHTGERPYKCNLCPASFSQSGNLNSHMYSHTGEKPHKCNDCEASFSHVSSLRKHVRVHTTEKPHKCNFCKASFSRQSYLTRHLQTHNIENPHRCNFCEASFSDPLSLKFHVRTHMYGKIFRCSYCNFVSSRESNLKRHTQTHIDNRPTDGPPVATPSVARASHKAGRTETHHLNEGPDALNICETEMSDEYGSAIPAGCLSRESLHETKPLVDSPCGSSSLPGHSTPTSSSPNVPVRIKEEPQDTLMIWTGISPDLTIPPGEEMVKVKLEKQDPDEEVAV